MTRTPAPGARLPGSLDETAAGIRASGRAALEIVADLHDHASLRRGVDTVLAEWGGIDLLVNNAVDTGPGSMVPILELTIDQMEAKLDANMVAQLVLVQAVLPGMLARGGGIIVDVTSHTATADPPGPVGQGGWGLAYAASKAAFHRIAPMVAVEMGDGGIRAFNVDPGYVDTERQQVNAAALGLVGHYTGRLPRPRRPPSCGWPPPRGLRERPDRPGPQARTVPRPPPRLAALGLGTGPEPRRQRG